jgi:prepilin-type N-terminal cleavage/methylation domain-containing protein
MLPPTKSTLNQRQSAGFTLIELLIGMALVAALSAATINLLYDVTTTRSKQYSLENSSDHLRLILNDITRSIQSGRLIDIDTASLKITGSPCTTYTYDADAASLSRTTDPTAGCTPPETGLDILHPDELKITSFVVTPLGNSPAVVNLSIEGEYRNSLGQHPLIYQTTITPRISL